MKIDILVKKFGLRPALKRDIGLFTSGCIALGYTKFLRELIGISYDAFGAIGDIDSYQSLVNEKDVSQKTAIFLQKNKFSIKKSFNPAKNLFAQTRKRISSAKKYLNNNPQMFLSVIVREYPRYFSALGAYNCLWRYLGNENKNVFSEKQIKLLGNDRNKVASLYPEVEHLLKIVFISMGRRGGYDGKFLKLLTFEEMSNFLQTKNLTVKLKNILKQRSRGYIHIYVSTADKEYVSTDPQIIRKTRNFFDIRIRKENNLQGLGTFPGIVTGMVYNADDFKNPKSCSGRILVAHNTHPKFLPLIKSAKAIVTDEGGILSHAAIISRELKKPCIVGTKIATKVLKDGDMIEVNAEIGIVKILKYANEK